MVTTVMGLVIIVYTTQYNQREKMFIRMKIEPGNFNHFRPSASDIVLKMNIIMEINYN